MCYRWSMTVQSEFEPSSAEASSNFVHGEHYITGCLRSYNPYLISLNRLTSLLDIIPLLVQI